MAPVGESTTAADLKAMGRCTATAKSTGGRCTQPVTPPATVCRFHGGHAPQVLAAVERRKREAELARAAQTYGAPVGIPAAEAMQDLIDRTYGNLRYVVAIMASLTEEDLRADLFWLERYDAERDRLAKLGKSMLDAGIAERQVRLAEEQGRQLANVLRDVLGDVFGLLTEAGLSIDVLVRIQREAVPALVRRRLSEVMEVSGG